MSNKYQLYNTEEPVTLADLTPDSNFKKLSLHRNLTFEWILKFPDGNWDYKALTHRYNFSKGWFYAYPEKPWDLKKLSQTYNLTLKDLLKIDSCENKLDFRDLSHNKNVNYEWIKLFPQANWDLEVLATHHNFSTAWLMIIDPKKWDYQKLSRNREMKWEVVNRHIDENWDFRALSHTYYLSYYWFEKLQDQDWDYQVLYDRFIRISDKNPLHISVETVETWINLFPTEKLDYDDLSQHQFLNLEWIERHKSGNWNFRKMSYLRPFSRSRDLQFIDKQWLLKYQDEDWDPDGLMEQPMFELTWLLILPNLKWNLKKVKYQSNEILLEHIIKFPELLFQRNCLGFHRHITKNWLEYIPDTGNNYSQLSKNLKVSCKWLLEKPEASWDFKSMSERDDLSLEIFQQFADKPWDYALLSKNRYLDINIVKEYPDKPWVFSSLSDNYKIALPILQHFRDKDWDFSVLSNGNRVDSSYLLEFPDKPWCFDRLSKNQHLKLDCVKTLPDKPWNFEHISWKTFLDVEWLKTFPDKPWDFKHLSRNKYLTLEWLRVIPDGDWDFRYLAHHRNFRVDWYREFPDKNWDFKYLGQRKNTKHLIMEFQHKRPHIQFVDTYDYRWSLPKHKFKAQCLLLMNPENQVNDIPNFSTPEYTKVSQELDGEARYNITQIYKYKIKIYKPIPEIFWNPSSPLLLTDLSGDSYEVPGWCQARNLLKHIHETLPELGKIDIYIESFTDKPDQLGSQSYTKHLKYLLFNNPNGPQAMIVYPEADAVGDIVVEE